MDGGSARTLLGPLGRLAAAPARGPLRAAGSLLEPVRTDLRRNVRRSLGVPADPPPRSTDPEDAFLPPGGAARRVHGDLPAMVIGGLAALLLQSLHPLAMAGVAEHSGYREDPIGRLRRTANFIGTTTFGTRAEAEAALEQVRRVHRRVHGTAPDGRPYSAEDPELLTWVHAAEVASFLASARRYGPGRLAQAERDRYLEETAAVALALGATWVPRSEAELEAYFGRVRPALYAGRQAIEARDFLLRGVARRPRDRAVHALVAAAAVSVLPEWARAELRIPRVAAIDPALDILVVGPAVRAFCAAVRWTVAPPAPVRAV
jgi:uncharacterized protein (DUF2236 family)